MGNVGGGINLASATIAVVEADAFLLKPPASQSGAFSSGLSQAWNAASTEIIHVKNNGGTAEFALYGQIFDYTTFNTPATNNVPQFNGTKWVTVPASSVGAVTSVSNSDGTLTISPTTGAVVASIALGHANTWTATQTYTPATAGTTMVALQAAAATSSTLTVASPVLDIFGTWWNGLASKSAGARFQTVLDAPGAPNGDFALFIVTVGSSLGNGGFGVVDIHSNNTALGYYSLFQMTPTNLGGGGTSNTAFGNGALQNTGGVPSQYNTGVGVNALVGTGAPSIGKQNSAFGALAAEKYTTANFNTAIGYSALAENTTGNYNTVVGHAAISFFNDTGSGNDYHVMIGYQAGFAYAGAEKNNIIIGAAQSNSDIAAGILNESNVIRLGNSESLHGFLGGPIATGTTTLFDSTSWSLLGAYWDGSKSVAYGFRTYANVTATTPTASFILALDNNGTLTSLWTLSQAGHITSANTYDGVQTFGNNISLGGAQLNVTGLATNDILQYNGTNWVNVLPTTIATTWSDMQDPSASSFTAGSATVGGMGVVFLAGANPGAGSGLFVLKSLNSTLSGNYLSIQNSAGSEIAHIDSSGNYVVGNTTKYADGSITVNAGVLTLPSAVTSTFAVLGLAQTWTAAQTFNSSDLLLNNPAATFAYTFAGAAITAARTITLPLLAANDTMAVLGLAQTFTALQTFGTNLSFLGAQVSGTPTTNQFLQYNGTNWVGAAAAIPNSASDTELTTTSATTIKTITPGAQGNFLLMVYFRVITASTVVTVTASWTDGTGAQTYTWVNAVSEAVGSYNLLPLFINATAAAITISATAGTANQVFVSATIAQL